MFIIEKTINDFHRKQENWEDARDKWIKEGEHNDGYNYRSPRDYRNRFGMSPTDKLKFIAHKVFIVTLVSIVTFCGVMWIEEASNNPPRVVKAASEYKNGEDCGTFKIGDIATIDMGDYQGAEVEIVGGCEDHADYETKVTKDMVLFAEGSSNAEYDDKEIKKDLIIKVNSADNLTKTGHKE